ncbi:hypothetical protein AUC68_12830 [Methyloceanibacter methanicus]|uniref:Glycosyltransferase 2-like domain-containing protein n=1 Tax=Methyloceanibacter methanicus TaxID=1774968 RepID=A0A1E3W604_9HYPH|nr:hypothetical protein AUC68_12830 [Methyloceanibacter methanicus]
MPAFNLENYLQETLASLSAQSEKRFEVLVVDDASSDATPDLVEHWAATDPRIRLIRHGERKGVSAARNRALSEAVGDYVLFVDGDDVVRADALETLTQSALADDADITRAIHWLWYPGDPVSLRPNMLEELNHPDIRTSCYRSCPSMVFAFSTWNTLFRRAFLQDLGARFNNDLEIGEDRLFNLQVYPHASSITYLKDYTYYWRMNRAESQTSKIRSSLRQNCGQMTAKLIKTALTTLEYIDASMRDLPTHSNWLKASIFCDVMNRMPTSRDEWYEIDEELRRDVLRIFDSAKFPIELIDSPFIKARHLDMKDAYKEFYYRYNTLNDIIGGMAEIHRR